MLFLKTSPFVRRYSVLVECNSVLEGSCSHELHWYFVLGDNTTGLEENPAVPQESHFLVEGSGSVRVESGFLLEGDCFGDEGSAHQL